MTMRAWIACAGASLLLGFAAGAAAEDASSEAAWAYKIANDLMSPYCPGRTLAECPSPQAGELRAWIIRQAESGRSQEDVLEEVYERFGDEVRPLPKAEGFGVTAYALPIGAFLAGGGIVFVVLRRLTSGREDDAPPAARAEPARAATRDDELERIIDEELGG